MGPAFAIVVFQASFCTIATTIVSGTLAVRTNYNAYILFSLLNTIVYCIPAGWVWRDSGWLYKLGALDFAGCACVHLIGNDYSTILELIHFYSRLTGGVSAFVAAYMLKPRVK